VFTLAVISVILLENWYYTDYFGNGALQWILFVPGFQQTPSLSVQEQLGDPNNAVLQENLSGISRSCAFVREPVKMSHTRLNEGL